MLLLLLLSNEFGIKWRYLWLLLLLAVSFSLNESLAPSLPATLQRFTTVVRVEESSHSIEQILVLVQVGLLIDQMQFELLTNVLVFQLLICADVVHQFS